VLSVTYLYRFQRMSRSVFVIDGLVLAALLVGSRMGFRLLPVVGDGARRASRRAIAYGAGDAGEMLARELLNNQRYSYQLVAFIDDDPYKHGRTIRSVPVVGGLAELDGLLDSGAEAVILTSNKLGAAAIQAVRAACEEADIPLLRFSCVLKEVGVRRSPDLRIAATAIASEAAPDHPPVPRT
jgi:UDP-GlcNAc:undecaprenyl-phosphate GlcNAc-1-phosphate transferase